MLKTFILTADRSRDKLTPLCVLSVFALFIAAVVYTSSQEELAEFLLSTSATSIAELREQSRSADLQKGTFERPVRLWGTVHAETPLLSPIGKTPCVYFSASVTRRWSYRTGSQTSRRTAYSYETLFQQRRGIDFLLKEGNDSIPIRIQGATVHGKDMDYDGSPPRAAIERLRISKAPGTKGGKTHRGDDYNEYLLPVGQKISVFGMASDRSGELRIEDAEHLLLTVQPLSETLNFYRNSILSTQVAEIVMPLAALCLLLGLLGKGSLSRYSTILRDELPTQSCQQAVREEPRLLLKGRLEQLPEDIQRMVLTKSGKPFQYIGPGYSITQYILVFLIVWSVAALCALGILIGEHDEWNILSGWGPPFLLWWIVIPWGSVGLMLQAQAYRRKRALYGKDEKGLYIGDDFLLRVKNQGTVFLLPRRQILKARPLKHIWRHRNREHVKSLTCLFVRENAETVHRIAVKCDMGLVKPFNAMELMKLWNVPIEQEELLVKGYHSNLDGTTYLLMD